MSCRKDPQWVNIPLVTETITRTGTRTERLQREAKKRDEKEQDSKRRKVEAQMAKILAKRWAEEDQRRKEGKPPLEPADDAHDERRSRRRRDRSEDRPRDSNGSFEGKRRRRGSSEESREARKGYESDEDADATGEQDSGGGGWHSAPARNSAVLAPISLRPADAPVQKAQEQKPAQKSKHAQKVAGIFGNIDSDDERTEARREMELAKRSKQSRMVTTMPGIATPGRIAGPSSSAASSAPAATPSDVQMRLAKWKLQCKGKHVDMPPDLRRDVESMMGRGQR